MVLKKIIVLALFVNILSSCTNSQTYKEKEKEGKHFWKNKIEKEKITTIISEKGWLSIDENCIWCWKCAFVAPENFKMNPQTFTADVISWENQDSPQVQEAKYICPTNSISN